MFCEQLQGEEFKLVMNIGKSILLSLKVRIPDLKVTENQLFDKKNSGL